MYNNLVKYFLIIGLVTSLIVNIGGVTSVAQSSEPVILKDGFIMTDNRTLVPLRELTETLGAEVVWDGSTRSIRIDNNNLVIVMIIDKELVSITDKLKMKTLNVTLDVPPAIYSNKTYIPVRFVSESLGAAVDWHADERVVTIVKDGVTLIIADVQRTTPINLSKIPIQPTSVAEIVIPEPEPTKPESVTTIPSDTEFAFKGITIGSSKADLDKAYGNSKRRIVSEYGFTWHLYHDQYNDFIMFGVQNNKVVGVYTNAGNWVSKSGVTFGSSRAMSRESFGKPLTYYLKGNTKYLFWTGEEGIDRFDTGKYYTTVFTDIHKDDTVTAIQLIDKDVEQSLVGFWAKSNDVLVSSFERMSFEVTNAYRVRNDLAPLTWSEGMATTARKHSVEMSETKVFSHTNANGESPFDRMDNDGHKYSTAGENLTAGYQSSVYGLEALMNSWGHRVNILKAGFTHLGVGVALTPEGEPYLTQKFFTPR